MEKALSVYSSSLLIQLAVALKNTTEQYPEFALASLGGNFAKAMFSLGWFLFAYTTTESWDRRRATTMTGALCVVIAVMHAKMAKAQGGSPNPYIMALFPLGWIIVTYGIMMKAGSMNGLAALGALLVLTSMMVVLPWQRKHCIVDSLGYSMFAVAWMLFAIVVHYQQKYIEL